MSLRGKEQEERTEKKKNRVEVCKGAKDIQSADCVICMMTTANFNEPLAPPQISRREKYMGKEEGEAKRTSLSFSS